MVVRKKVHIRPIMGMLIACLAGTLISTSALADSAGQADTRPAFKATPTVAPKAVPISFEALKNILLVDGDLPAGWTRAKIYDEGAVDYSGPTPKVVVSHGLKVTPNDKFASGDVTMYVFGTVADAHQAYEGRAELIERNVDKDAKFLHGLFGDESLLVPGHGKVFILNQLVFRQCRAVVEILLGKSDVVDMVKSYATRIQERIRPSVCKGK